ncbi:MFS transporter [Streptomyces hydrogenans]|uniref:MFS transporter n=1 Tax=Streptomyces hydrogenans TaxID=1873719 RepID=A0ABQ3PQP5_9ACTN|nr:MFS transporter [Streptomyces hydrogenans]GHF98465.1 MFS transporter [Streptomyces hydrogenans]GHI27351.1 MFS transporter [Streptomyces hydrogenans]
MAPHTAAHARHTAAPAPAPDRRRAWLITALIVTFMVINFADKSVLGLAAVPIMDELNLSNSTYGLISSSFYFLFSLSGLLVGFLSTSLSSRVLLFGMTLLWAVAQLPVLAVASVPTLLAGRILLGAAEGPAASMSMHALYKWFPPERRALPSALQIGGAALGTLIAAPLVTWLIEAYGWRSAYAVLAAVSAIWALVWWQAGHDGPYDHARTGTRTRTGAGTGKGDGPRLPYRRLLSTGTVLGSIASAFGAAWALSLSHAWLPAYLRTELDMSAESAATTISVISGYGLLLLLAISPVVDALKARGVSSRWSSGAAQSIAVCVAACAMAAFPFIESTGARLILIGLAFGTIAIAVPLHYMTTAEVVPTSQRGAVFGIVAGIGTLPGLVAPSLTGHLIDAGETPAHGYTAAFLTATAVMLVAGLLALTSIRPERDAHRLGLDHRPAGGAH